MQREPVHSSAVASVGYEPATNVLEIEFVDGDTYQYFAVPASVHAAFLAADSLGAYFARQIRHTYTSTKVS